MRCDRRFFVTGGQYHHNLVRGPGGVLPQRIWRLPNAIFSTCHEICHRKIDFEYKNGKQLQVTIIQITESKETKSIHRLNVSGSTGPATALAIIYNE